MNEVSYILVCTEFQNGEYYSYFSVPHTLWNELLLENAAFAAASNAAIFQHTWLPENYTYINVGVSFDVTTLVKCAVFHNTKHLSTLHFISSKGSMCCTRFRPALIPTAHRLCFNVPKKVLGFSERAINHYTIRKRFLGSDLRSTWHQVSLYKLCTDSIPETPAAIATAYRVLLEKFENRIWCIIMF